MPGKTFSIDEAVLNARPGVILRGTRYLIRDFTLAERLERMIELQRQQQEIENVPEKADPNDIRVKVSALLKEGVQQALEGVSDEVAESVTELEYKALTLAIARARDLTIPDVVEAKEPGKEKKRGGATE